MSCMVLADGGVPTKKFYFDTFNMYLQGKRDRKKEHAGPQDSCLLVCSPHQIICRRSFCSVALKQMSYLESSSFARVAMEQRGNEKLLMAQCWVYLISQFTLCFAGSVGTIPLCIFESSCDMLHQHSADPDMLPVVKIHIFLSTRAK